MSMYHSRALDHPVPYHPHKLSTLSRDDSITVAQLESLTLSVHQSAVHWLMPRGIPRRLYTGDDILYGEYRGVLLSMDVIADRWCLVIYQDATIVLWDIHPETDATDWDLGFKWSGVCSASSSPRCLRKQELKGIGLCISSAVCLNDTRDGLLFAVSKWVLSSRIRTNPNNVYLQ